MGEDTSAMSDAPRPPDAPRPRVVVVGGGFGGLRAVRALRGARLDVTLIDRRNFHLFQPLLYQVATGALASGEIAAPLRAVLKRQLNVTVILGEVRAIDLARRRVLVDAVAGGDGPRECPYDGLVVAAGARHSYFGHEDWEPVAPGLKTLEDALEIRRRILIAFESAEVEEDPRRQAEWLTFVVVGAGPTGVEVAGQIVEMARDTLRRDFRRIDTARARVLLVEAAPAVLGAFPSRQSARAARALERHGVEVVLERMVVDVTPEGIAVRGPDGRIERIAARTVVWGAGVEASGLATDLARTSGAELDRNGRVSVGPDLALPGHPEVRVVGDMARVAGPGGQPLPGVAPVAMQEGEYAGRALRAMLLGGRPPGPFRYHDRGNLATIGRARAVGQIRGLQVHGLIAWVIWLLVHLTYLIGFQNRLIVMIRWAVSFLTHGRGARLITGGRALPAAAGLGDGAGAAAGAPPVRSAEGRPTPGA
jgi:NADH:ubiquinone reductase (H+-translocating)